MSQSTSPLGEEIISSPRGEIISSEGSESLPIEVKKIRSGSREEKFFLKDMIAIEYLLSQKEISFKDKNIKTFFRESFTPAKNKEMKFSPYKQH